MADIQERLEHLLSHPRITADDAERAARAAEALAAYLRARDKAEALLRAATQPSVFDRLCEVESLAGLTLHDAAEQVLIRAGVPLHVRELGKRIKGGGWTHPRSNNPRADQILYQLAARLPRHPEHFVRVAPNTFALTSWKQEGKPRARPRLGLFRSREPAASTSHEDESVPALDDPWHSS